MAKATATIRKGKASDWPTKGQTPDGGAGSRARNLLATMQADEKEIKKMMGTFTKVVTAVKGLNEDQQRVVCLAAASDFSLEAIIEKSAEGRASYRSLSQRRMDWIKSQVGDKALSIDEVAEWMAKAKDAVKGRSAA